MPIQLKEEDHGRIIVFHVSGVLTKEEYDRIIPQVKPLLRQQKTLRILFEMTDFHGWEPSALWEELKFDEAQFSDLSIIDRCALVGERKWQSIMATLSKPFTSAEIRYFDHTDLASAEVAGCTAISSCESEIGQDRSARTGGRCSCFWRDGDRCACGGRIGNRAVTNYGSSN